METTNNSINLNEKGVKKKQCRNLHKKIFICKSCDHITLNEASFSMKQNILTIPKKSVKLQMLDAWRYKINLFHQPPQEYN